MMKDKVMRCITNGATVTGFDNDRRLPDGQRDLGPTFNAMRNNQQERRDQEGQYWSQFANASNQLGGQNLYGMLSGIGGSCAQGNSSVAWAGNYYKQNDRRP